MSIDWDFFSPWTALAGGLIIGAAAAMFIVLNGRIAGISSVLGGLLRPSRGDFGWRLAFVSGLVASPLAWAAFRVLPVLRIDAGYPQLVIAGLLVGFGTRYGSGCTSGHGVCGIARLSPRSIAATAAFVGSGFLTVYAVRHLT